MTVVAQATLKLDADEVSAIGMVAMVVQKGRSPSERPSVSQPIMNIVGTVLKQPY